MSGVSEPVQTVEQALNVRQVEPGGRLVQDVENVPASLQFAQFGCEFDSLSLTSRKRCRRLAECQVAQTEIIHRSDFFPDRGNILEKSDAFFDRCIQYIRNRLISIQDLERFGVVSLALAGRAQHFDVGHEVHPSLDGPLAPWHSSQRPPLTLKLNRPGL